MITEFKIAVASSDGTAVDVSFGRAEHFFIFDMREDGSHVLAEVRPVPVQQNAVDAVVCGGHGHDVRAELLRDCRVVLCAKIGPQARTALERWSISVFDVNMTVDDALAKIIAYFRKTNQRKPHYDWREQEQT